MNLQRLQAFGYVLLLSLLLIASASASITLTDINAGLTGVGSSGLAWGDYDGDGDLDLALAGTAGGVSVTRIYRNDGGTFVDVDAGLPGMDARSIAWGDYDNDGDLDLAAAGDFYARVFRNDSGTFTDINAGLDRIDRGAIAWGDYDNDGDLDLALTGATYSASMVTKIYRNDGGAFTDANAGLAALRDSDLAWGDYDNDGDLDLVVIGSNWGTPVSTIYRNDAGTFVDAGAGLKATTAGSVAWGDYDNDGDLDLLLRDSGSVRLYRNDEGTFVDTGILLLGYHALWVDYDNDGDLDLSAYDGTAAVIYRNDGEGSFVNSGIALPGCVAAWGDYDADGDLDVAVLGQFGSSTRIYRSDGALANTPPTAPTGLSFRGAAGGLELSWERASDNETPSLGLSYNVRLGTEPGKSDIFSGMADPSTGLRQVPAVGNAQKRLSWVLRGLAPKTCYWSVQAIDSGFAGSAWAPEQPVTTVSISGCISTPDGQPVAGVTVDADNGGGTATTFTFTNGCYSLTVFRGWSGKVTPRKAGCFLSPECRDYADLQGSLGGQNYTVSRWFVSAEAALVGIRDCSVAWGDYDNDGDLDLAAAGMSSSGPITAIYRNDGGVFVETGAGLVGVTAASLAWGDYDGDGDLDLAVAGDDGTKAITTIYCSADGSFAEINAGLRGALNGCIAWGDYDNDGDLDIIVAGNDGFTTFTTIYKNASGAFIPTQDAFPGLEFCSLAWADYDSDGDLDLALSGDNAGTPIAKLYRNDGGAFSEAFPLTGVSHSSLAWADYDSDGDPDLVVSGYTGSRSMTDIYENFSGIFSEVYASITGVKDASVAWGDYDNDGDPDLALAGTGPSGPLTRIYQNDAGRFAAIDSALPGYSDCSCAWGDYDSDGDLDLLVTGDTNGTPAAVLYRNGLNLPNTPPSAPTALHADLSHGGVTFTWNPAADDHTPSESLSYNLRVGTAPGKQDVFSGAADLSSGLRRMPAGGNVQQRLSWTLKDLESGTAYWSVQAIDSTFAGGSWALEESIAVVSVSGHVRTPAGEPIPGVKLTSSSANVEASTDAEGYYCALVQPDWSGTITPSLGNYWFDPHYRSYTGLTDGIGDQDFAGRMCFSVVDCGLLPVKECAAAWGDYDNDGDLDLAIGGTAAAGSAFKVYRNDGGNFADTDAAIPGFSRCSLAWGDYDNDGQLDLVVAGLVDGVAATRIYHNTNGSFSDINAGLVGINGVCAWGDYDNDGDLDLVSAGYAGTSIVTKLYRNDKGTFTDTNAGLTGVSGCCAWGDYDNDGDLDLALAGVNSTAYYIVVTKIYRNDDGVFVDAQAGLQGVGNCSLAWADYDNDGDLDLALAGGTSSGQGAAKIYRNDGGVFTDIQAQLAPMSSARLAWGDVDNDGDPDLAVSGSSQSANVAFVYRNDEGTFVDIGAGVVGVSFSALAWGDFDNDHDLDLIVSGWNYSGTYAKLYRNLLNVPNSPPEPPSDLSASVSDGGVTFSWNSAADSRTPSGGLSYNLRVGTTPGGCDVFSGMADATTGLRRVPALGNAQKNLSWTVKGLPVGVYYWSVQAIDAAFAGSPWAVEQVFSVGALPIGAVKALPDGVAVVLDSCVITAVFSDSFYIEENDRSSGIRVDGGQIEPVVGASVHVEGVVKTDAAGERYIDATRCLLSRVFLCYTGRNWSILV